MKSRAFILPTRFLGMLLLSAIFASNGHSGALVIESSPHAESSPAGTAPTPAADKKKLTADFKKMLSTEEKTLIRQQRIDLKNYQFSQNTEQKTWHDQEKKARKVYFETHPSGPERRQYVQAYLLRKTNYEKTQKDALVYFKNVSKEKYDQFKDSQKKREQQFKSQLDQNQQP